MPTLHRNLQRITAGACMLACIAAPAAGATPAVQKTYANSNGTFGLGLILGEPTGVGGRYWFSEDMAVQGVIGGTYRYAGAIVAADLIVGFRRIIPANSSVVRFDLSLGGGALFGLWESGYHCHSGPWSVCHRHSGFALGARGPATFSAVFEKIQLEAFVEVAPVLLVLPALDLDLEGGIGARYYF